MKYTVALDKDPDALTKFSLGIDGQEVWIGDPCYILRGNEEWSKVCDTLPLNCCNGCVLAITLRDSLHKIFVCQTAYGDGCYPVLVDGDEIGAAGVDAGLLCIATNELATLLRDMFKDSSYRCGVVTRPLHAKKIVAGGGNFSLGNVSVRTDGEE